jgi:hypothetical protein
MEAAEKADSPDRETRLSMAGRYLKNLRPFAAPELAYLRAVGELLIRYIASALWSTHQALAYM